MGHLQQSATAFWVDGYPQGLQFISPLTGELVQLTDAGDADRYLRANGVSAQGTVGPVMFSGLCRTPPAYRVARCRRIERARKPWHLFSSWHSPDRARARIARQYMPRSDAGEVVLAELSCAHYAPGECYHKSLDEAMVLAARGGDFTLNYGVLAPTTRMHAWVELHEGDVTYLLDENPDFVGAFQTSLQFGFRSGAAALS